jgi:hypothetical protein
MSATDLTILMDMSPAYARTGDAPTAMATAVIPAGSPRAGSGQADAGEVEPWHESNPTAASERNHAELMELIELLEPNPPLDPSTNDGT